MPVDTVDVTLNPRTAQTPQQVQAGYQPRYRGSQYLEDFVNPETLKERIRFACRALQGYKFDAIAFTGMSGALIGPPVAMELGKSVIMCRKPDTSTHSSYEVEGDANADTYIILDDLTSSGGTKRRIIEQIRKWNPSAEYIGLLGVGGLCESNFEYYERKNRGTNDTRYPLTDFGAYNRQERDVFDDLVVAPDEIVDGNTIATPGEMPQYRSWFAPMPTTGNGILQFSIAPPDSTQRVRVVNTEEPPWTV